MEIGQGRRKAAGRPWLPLFASSLGRLFLQDKVRACRGAAAAGELIGLVDVRFTAPYENVPFQASARNFGSMRRRRLGRRNSSFVAMTRLERAALKRSLLPGRQPEIELDQWQGELQFVTRFAMAKDIEIDQGVQEGAEV